MAYKDFLGTADYSVGDPTATHVRGLGLGPKYSLFMSSPALLATGWPISSKKTCFGHPHKEQYDQVDVHTECPFGISNRSATEYVFEYINQTAVTAGTMWRDEIYLVIEWYNIVNSVVDRLTRRVGVTFKLN